MNPHRIARSTALDSSCRGIPSDRLSGGTGTIEGTFTAPAFVDPVTKIFIIPDLGFRVQKRMSEKTIEGVVLLTLLHPPYESGSRLKAPVPEATHHHVSQVSLRRVQGSPDLQKSMIWPLGRKAPSHTDQIKDKSSGRGRGA